MEDFDGVMSEIESVSDAVSRMNLDDDLDVEEEECVYHRYRHLQGRIFFLPLT